jgi:hypothetical protein
MMISNVISRPAGAVAKISVIAKMHKYRGLHQGHHFISMAMKVHGAPWCDIDRFIKKCVHLFHDRQSNYYLFL